jgi:hypothetical protein
MNFAGLFRYQLYEEIIREKSDDNQGGTAIIRPCFIWGTIFCVLLVRTP